MKKLALPIILIAVLLSACGLPSEVKDKAKSLEVKCTETLVFITAQEKTFEAAKKGKDGEFLTPYADKEKWSESFKDAKDRVKDAQTYITVVIDPVLERNKNKEELALYKYIIKVNTTLSEAKKFARAPNQRRTFILDARKNASSMFKQAQEDVKASKKLVAGAKKKSELAKVDAKKEKWGKSDSGFDKVFSPLQDDLNKSKDALVLIVNEMTKVDKGYSADYAIIGDKIAVVAALLTGLQKKQPAFLKKTDELYKSYSKTLEDMRIDYYVEIGRMSWDEAYDYPTEYTRNKTSKQVSEDVYNFFGKIGVVGTYGYWSKFKLKSNVSQSMWNALGINPTYNWVSDDDGAEYYVNNTIAKTYHKYTVANNEKEKSTGWVEVREDFYWANDANLGMTIISKPYGMYESEVITDAAPKGMQYIADPVMVKGVPTGSNEYGSWKKDPATGNYFWSVVGGVMVGNMASNMMFGGNRYYYDDYNGYRNHNRGSGYYGQGGGYYGTYGSSTYRTGSHYSNSNYAKRNAGSVREARASRTTTRRASVKGSSSRSSKSSVRSAGKSNRGRGASGKGGK